MLQYKDWKVNRTNLGIVMEVWTLCRSLAAQIDFSRTFGTIFRFTKHKTFVFKDEGYFNLGRTTDSFFNLLTTSAVKGYLFFYSQKKLISIIGKIYIVIPNKQNILIKEAPNDLVVTITSRAKWDCAAYKLKLTKISCWCENHVKG